MTALAVFAAALLVYALLSARLEQASISGPLLLVSAGIVAGPKVLDVVHTDLAHGAGLLFAELTLAVLLFSDAARIDLRSLRREAALSGRLLAIGMPLTIGLGVVAGALLLGDLDVWEAAMIAAILAPTDAALGQTVVTSPRIPSRIRRALTVESGLNDGLSVSFLALFLVLAVENESPSAHDWLGDSLQLIGIGVVTGALVGGLGARLADRALAARLTTPAVAALAPVALAVLCWALADALGGNGFIAAFAGGLCAAPLRSDRSEGVLEFAEQTGSLLSLAVVFIFGTVALDLLEPADAAIVAYAVLSLTAIRMVPVALAMAGTGSRASTVAFMGWFGPRGLASIVLALTVAEQEPGLPGLDRVMAAVTVTVLMSIVAHGLTARWLLRAYGAAVRDLPEDAPEHGVAEPPPAETPAVGT